MGSAYERSPQVQEDKSRRSGAERGGSPKMAPKISPRLLWNRLRPSRFSVN
jgi:hypothetical protein